MSKPMRWCSRLAVLSLFAVLAGCGVSPQKVTVPVVASVDLPRFMGPWYVIGVIPTFIEKDIYNAIETYEQAPDGSISTTFTFNKGALDGPAKQMNPRGFVIPGTNNAIWGMQFIWPIKAEYVISHLDENYSETIIARSARDYVWIMARSPNMSAARYAELTAKVAAMGYDTSKLVKIQHSPAPMPSPAEVAAILSGIERISPAELRQRLADTATPAPVVLDVRTAEEFAAGHVPGAINRPHAEIAANPEAVLSLAKDADIVLYCGTGRRASVAVQALQAAGFKRLTHMSGDYPAWASENPAQ